MKTNYLEQSLIYERAASECYDIISRLKSKRAVAENDARMRGEQMPGHYDLVIAEVKALKDEYSKNANSFWRLHKSQMPDICDKGAYNLLEAIVTSWAMDYEQALSKKQAARIAELRREADNLVRDSVVARIERTHKRFVEIAHTKIDEIVCDTERAREISSHLKKGADHTAAHMRNRCPLCGGGLFAQKTKSNLYIVKCSGCYLTEVVKVEDEPWKN